MTVSNPQVRVTPENQMRLALMLRSAPLSRRVNETIHEAYDARGQLAAILLRLYGDRAGDLTDATGFPAQVDDLVERFDCVGLLRLIRAKAKMQGMEL